MIGQQPSISSLIDCHLSYLGLPFISIIKEAPDRIFGMDSTGAIEAYCVENNWSKDILSTIQKNHGKSAVASYRERNTFPECGLQVVVHLISGQRVLEIDEDLHPPQHERPLAIFAHTWDVLLEKIRKKSTSNLKVWESLKRRGIWKDAFYRQLHTETTS